MLSTFLNKELQRRKQRNPKYSIRAFAKSLGVDSSTLSKILKGSRSPNPAFSNRVLSKLNVDDAMKNAILLSEITGDSALAPGDEEFVFMEKDAIEQTCFWEFYAVLSLIEIKTTRSSPAWMAKTLNAEIDKVNLALELLEKYKLVRRQNSKWVVTGARLSTPRGIEVDGLKKVHREYIERGLYSLEYHERSERDISGITVAVSRKKLPEAIRRIKDFRRSLARFLTDDEELDEVYRLNVQLFPLKK